MDALGRCGCIAALLSNRVGRQTRGISPLPLALLNYARVDSGNVAFFRAIRYVSTPRRALEAVAPTPLAFRGYRL